ncbi:MAG: 3'-5' exonuclease, partial [Bacteroidota bacterium]
FRDFPDVLEKYQKQFLYILVDEFQDTNYAQNLILLKLSALSRNICVVGDDAQSIYSFRGARIENILNFRNDFQEYKLFKLEQNYRSTKNILDAANSVIEKNNSQIPKRIWSSKDQGHLIKIIKAFTDGEEGYIIANQITDWVRTGRSRFSECAVLYRTNAQSRIIEESLRKRNIPYKVYGGLSFYQRKEVKDLLAYFRLVINHNDDEAFRRIINYPPRGIGKTSVEKMEAAANSRNISLWEAIHLEEGHDLKGAGIARFMEFAAYINDLTGRAAAENAWDFAMHVASTSGILKELYNEKTPEGLSRYENIQEILNSIRDFSDNLLEEEGEEAVRIERYMENVALLTDQDTDKTQDKDRVSLMTIHSAKGLEFDNVFIAGVEEELFPSGYNLLSESDLEEERRLFYVAITRARINVSIGFASSRYKWGSLNSTKPSRFISEIDNKYLDMPPLVRAEIFPGETIFKVKTPIENKKTERPFSSRSLPESNQGKEEQKQIYAGMKVEHAKFGIGKVLSVEGSYPEIKATVFFHNVGQKKLLLKFAHLKVLD